ncbi:MAG: dTDP-4-dehydrorhamnose 3,5-epimerase [Verrucomicrobia bacterium]|jgi:dTDP-4-dehydrorhamnose 3,5-epimerase|nr:dTDP-4-dehydrorhamnose 3,5-epimerase [Verrucomicrobiota bacterium]MBT7067689.1 dTDP-4-dehydrorhamnose 3,5-epimerase [Verrucomicrobiota bacterium]MBT7702357.1 dTDP-4-dehydrorhamnose 3,5-epimerase [Verrucomicrobiota bacterium]
MPFTFETLELDGLIAVQARVFPDSRGFFLESYKKSEFERGGISEDFVQDNHSGSRKGVLRGLHYQLDPHAQGKLVSVLAGTIWDVAVDLRQSSKTFGKWAGVELSAAKKNALWIPAGFAHGFVCLSESADVFYKTTAEYCGPAERGIRWDDPHLAIDWPSGAVSVSERDAALPHWEAAALFP